MTQAASIATLFQVLSYRLKSASRGIIPTGRIKNFSCFWQLNCLFLVKLCFIQHHDDFLPKTNSCSKITRSIWPIPGPVLARNRFCRPRRSSPSMHKLSFNHTAIRSSCVGSRIRYENGSVDANRSMRFRSYETHTLETHTFVFGLTKRIGVDRA